MTTRVTSFIVIMILIAPHAIAAKLRQRMTPGKNFQVTPLKDKRLQYTITRDLSETMKPRDDEIVIRRTGHLRITKNGIDIVSATIAPTKNKAGKIVYRFIVSKDFADSTVFTLSEIEHDRSGIGYLGGGRIYDYALPTVPGFSETLDPFADR